jgi:hypothetical protein
MNIKITFNKIDKALNILVKRNHKLYKSLINKKRTIFKKGLCILIHYKEI